MSTVQDALASARTFLNDDSALQWHDQSLFPKLVQAHNELVSKLVLNGVSTMYRTTARATISIGSIDMGVNQPTGLARPIKMFEWLVGDDESNARPMIKCDFLPKLERSDTLRYWCWSNNLITFLGANQDRQVQLMYDGVVTAPTTVNDVLFYTLSETYLGPRIAALVRISSPDYETLSSIAEDNLSKLVRTQVKESQALPVRRRPFSHSMKSRRHF